MVLLFDCNAFGVAILFHFLPIVGIIHPNEATGIAASSLDADLLDDNVRELVLRSCKHGILVARKLVHNDDLVAILASGLSVRDR
jgi:hypothetical protein